MKRDPLCPLRCVSADLHINCLSERGMIDIWTVAQESDVALVFPAGMHWFIFLQQHSLPVGILEQDCPTCSLGTRIQIIIMASNNLLNSKQPKDVKLNVMQ